MGKGSNIFSFGMGEMFLRQGFVHSKLIPYKTYLRQFIIIILGILQKNVTYFKRYISSSNVNNLMCYNVFDNILLMNSKCSI